MTDIVDIGAFRTGRIAASTGRHGKTMSAECPVCDRSVEPASVSATGEIAYVCRGVEGTDDEHFRFRWTFEDVKALDA